MTAGGRLVVAGDADGALRWITPDWPAPPGVRALSTLRLGGVSEGPHASLNLADHVADDAARVAENRRRLRRAAALPADPAWLSQVHGIAVQELGTRPAAGLADAAATGAAAGPADASVTRCAATICAVLTADCLPVLFASRAGDRVGAAHAGWRGLSAGVLEATVRALACPAAELIAWLGPAIGPNRFEVGPEVRQALLEGPTGGAGDASAFRSAPGGHYLADLYLLARRRLARVGVQTVYGGGACTYTENDRYFSHRRDGRTGRQATLIWLEAGPAG